MADNAAQIRADIAQMESLAAAAVKRKDFDNARKLDMMIQNAEIELANMGENKSEALDFTVEAKGLGGTVIAGLEQGFTEDLPAGVRGILPLAMGDREARAKIAEEQLPIEQMFQSQTREHPFAAALSRSAPLFLLSGGRTGPGAMARGALGGISMFNPDPVKQAEASAFGSVANLAGRGLLGRLGMNRQTQMANATGMRLMPEQRGPTLLPQHIVENSDAFRNQAFRLGEINARTITREALKTTGSKSRTFDDRTLGKIESDIGERFDAALSGKERMFLGQNVENQLDELLENVLDSSTKPAGAKRAIKFIKAKINKADDIIDISEYQSLRSGLTDDLFSTPMKNKKLRSALGQMIEILDDAAARNLPPSKLRALTKARQQWKQFALLKTPGVVNFKSGNINPKKLTRLYEGKDEAGFTLGRDRGKLMEMLRVDRAAPFSKTNVDPLSNIRDMRLHPGFAGRGAAFMFEKPILGASRLPVRAIEGAPLAATIPLLRPPVQGRGDESDELVIRR